MSNIKVSFELIETLARCGVMDYCVCPGSRNAPLIEVLEKCENIRVFYHFDERAAGFFALGRMKKTGRPVAVVTTSGTAVMETLPALTEAYYSNCPLVVLSADRPKYFRQSGAPQVVDQMGVLRSVVDQELDLEAANSKDVFVLQQLKTLERSIHINICFDEPLLDEPISSWRVSHKGDSLKCLSLVDLKMEPLETPQISKPLVILSGLSDKVYDDVKEWLKNWSGPVYAEAPSGLRQEDTNTFWVRDPQEVETLFSHQILDSVIRIGDVPTLRFWRDLERKYKNIPVLSLSERAFSGLGRCPDKPYALTKSHLQTLLNMRWDFSKALSQKEKISNRDKVSGLLSQYPLSEPAMIYQLSQRIDSCSFLFLGNSLPIREWDQFAERKGWKCSANRGANGIDGLLASFLGQCQSKGENWCVIGDQSALYDLNSLALVKEQGEGVIRIVVVNNGGGCIFRQLNYADYFSNPHTFNFSGAAEMFGLEYCCYKGEGEFPTPTKSHTLIELVPAQNESDQFWSSYKRDSV